MQSTSAGGTGGVKRQLCLTLLGASVLLFVVRQASAQPLPVDEPPPPMKRAGFLFLESSALGAAPRRDLQDRSLGDATTGWGWRTTLGVWITEHVTLGVEFGTLMIGRRTDTDPFTGLLFQNLVDTRYRIGWRHFSVRYYMAVKERVIWYGLMNFGQLTPGFEFDYVDAGRTETYLHSGRGKASGSFGVGVIVVFLDHAAVGVEARSMEWFDDEFLPGPRMWSTFQGLVSLSWHF